MFDLSKFLLEYEQSFQLTKVNCFVASTKNFNYFIYLPIPKQVFHLMFGLMVFAMYMTIEIGFWV